MIDLPLLIRISQDLDVPRELVERLIQRAPHTYKSYSVPKKNGGKRFISQPAKETKYLQYWLIKNILNELPIHESATAYRQGASIRNNALVHSPNSYLAKFDFRNFFTSIKASDVKTHLANHQGHVYSEEELNLIVRVVCMHVSSKTGLRLTIGSPSSPLLSNTIMYEFDEMISGWSKRSGFLYTRYADDLTFSTSEKNISHEIEKELTKTIKVIRYPRLRLNRSKTVLLSKKNNRRITGVTISNEGQLSLGRDRKRLIRSMIHRYKQGILESEKVYKLQGILAFAKDIEPKFIERMEAKYGKKLISDILSRRKPKSSLITNQKSV